MRVSAALDRPGARVQVLRDGKRVATFASYTEDPGMTPRVTLTEGAHGASRAPCCTAGGMQDTATVEHAWPLSARVAKQGAHWPIVGF